MTPTTQPTLPIRRIVQGKNPREYFDPDEMAELEEGIRAVGVLEPIVVRPVPGTDLYEIIAGERRWRAAKNVFGDDYDTRDGTAVRDYVHVLDLADAHVAALKRLLAGGSSETFNLGSGTGTTVRELVDGVGRAAGKPLVVETAPRRPGDAPVLVADNAKARQMLGWKPSRDLGAILSTAWRWHRAQAAINSSR